MISKSSELLELFINEETKKLAGIKMPHMPTLGSAYEEMTKHGLNKDFAIPKHLDLSVVSGFVSIGDEVLPEQIDCMLVHGGGKRYGLTEQYIYDIENILCIFEVKKTLNKADCIDAINHLANIRIRFSEYISNKITHERYNPEINSARRHFSQITGKIAPEQYSKIHELSESDATLFYCLVQESLAPVSIIHGYDGYKTESGFRKAFIDILDEVKNENGCGIGIPSIPSLVTSNQLCLVKANGVPFVAIKDQDEWVAVFSTRHNSAKLILELIWTKISNRFNVKMPWDDGLHMENIEPLLIAKVIKVDGNVGWLYRSLEYKEKALLREDNHTWEPAKLGKVEILAVNMMAMHGGYLSLDGGLGEYLRDKYGVTIDEVVQKLIFTRLFMKDGEYLRPIHTHTYVAMSDEYTGFASSEIERFEFWCDENSVSKNYMHLFFLE